MTHKIENDWYPGEIPANVIVGAGAFIETTYSLRHFHSRRDPGITFGPHSSAYMGCTFVVGEDGRLNVGEYSLLNGVYLRCDQEVQIGNRVLIAWNVGIFDTHGLPREPHTRAEILNAARTFPYGKWPIIESAPVVIEDDVWIGFGAILLPGVRIGAGSVIGALSVVTKSVPQGVVAAGNPARVVKEIPSSERERN